MGNYYELLEVSKNASSEVISKVFKYHIKKNHPDLFEGKEKEQAEVKVKILNEAYDVLSNPEKRREYDEKLAEEERLKNSVKDEEINNLNIEKKYLLNTIDSYNRFINEYFYEKADEVFEIISSYDSENYKVYQTSKNSGVNQTQNKVGINQKLRNYLFKASVYIIAIILFFTIISILFRVNVFSIMFDIIFK